MSAASLKTGTTAGKSKQAEIGPVLARFETKYTIPLSMVDSISDFISPYCSLDKYSEQSPDRYYGINSLYFDTPSFLFLRQRMLRAENRFNMRVRTYGDEPQLPYYLEIKQRQGDVVRKFRAKSFETNLSGLLHDAGPAGTEDMDVKNRENLELFTKTRHRYNAQPAVIIQYKRKAYISDCDDYARVTFDRNISYMQQNDYDPVPVESKMTPCDVQTCFDPGTCVILELKCYTTYVPLWMIDCVRAFELRRRGFSKYATCMRSVFQRNTQGNWHLRNSCVFEDD
jgi:hypothetical protein